MVEIELVTGKRGEPHIKSEHIGSFNNAIIGDGGKYVLDSGKKFSYEIVSNNLLRIYDGDAVNQGRHMLIKRGEYVDVPIENGTQSQKRSDIIVLKYKKNTSTGVETAGLDIIKGVPGDVPTDPEYLSTDILTSATEDDMPLYRVYLNGLNIESVEPLFDVLVPIKKMKDMQEEIEQLNSDLTNFKQVYLGNEEIRILYNNILAFIYIRKSITLTGGNVVQSLYDITENIAFNGTVFCPCEVLNSSWVPFGNSGYLTLEGKKIGIRCKESITNGAVIAAVVIPRHFLKIT